MISLKFLVSIFIEFGSVLVFTYFAASYDFFTGVKALLIATFFSLVISVVRDKRIPLFSLISSGFIYIFGLLGLYYNDPYFVVLEITLFNLSFLFLVVFYQKYLMKNFFKTLFGNIFSITDKGWKIISFRWNVAFLIVTVANEFIWHSMGEQVWIYYRLYMFIFLGIFGFYQFTVSRRERLPGASSWGLKI